MCIADFNDIRENITLKPLEDVATSLYLKSDRAAHIHIYIFYFTLAVRHYSIPWRDKFAAAALFPDGIDSKMRARDEFN